MKKRIAILGSTGSIGRQALEVIKANSAHYNAEILTALDNYKLLIQQAIEHHPDSVVIGNDEHYKTVSDALIPRGIKVYAGAEAVSQIVGQGNIDIVLVALVGFAGLIPTINAIKAGKHIALANKETLVVAGFIIKELVSENRTKIIPVDSEHSAIFQCLAGEGDNEIEKIILTASGGPFRGKTSDFLEGAGKEEALQHPNWNMGRKITIDSATLMNKGLEVIEARWLFDLTPEQIEVVIHPQSIIHSIVQFRDGSMKAQMGLPDMKLPIQYAFSYPGRIATDSKRFSFGDYPELNFEQPDLKNFSNLALAFKALKKGGNSPCVLNASNEVAVEAFLNDQIGFMQIAEVNLMGLENTGFISDPSLEELINTDKEARANARDLILKLKH